MKKNELRSNVRAYLQGVALSGLLIVFACHGAAPVTKPTPTPTSSGSVINSPAGDMVTYHNDNMRTGQNPHETVLNRTNVNSGTFGKVGALPVDGQVYAQPLYVKNVSVPQLGSRNLVFVATEHDSVYAFDGDSLSTIPIWYRSFLGDSEYDCNNCSTLSYLEVNAPNIAPEVGITATPVIDAAAGTMYVVAMTQENGQIFWKLHALDITTGKERAGSPVVVSGTLKGTGVGSDLATGMLTFDPLTHLERAGLTLANGTVYMAFSSFDDGEPTHGWLFSFDAKTLSSKSAFVTTPNAGEGNIWMSGAAPAVDNSGDIYFSTGNGDPGYEASTDTIDLDNAVLKMSLTSSGFHVLDWFQPYNHITLTNGDVELGSGGVSLFPDQPGPYPHLMVTGGKEGTIYLLNRDHLGHFNTASNATNDPQIVQELLHELPGGQSGGPGIYGTSAYFEGKLFIAGAGDSLRSYPIVNGQIETSQKSVANEKIKYRGATPSISSNGTSAGIVWILDPSAFTYSVPNATYPEYTIVSNGPTVLRAYSTDSLSAPLYSSNVNSADAAGNAVKFAVPTVVDGKVFVGTDSEISVYGLKY